MSSADYLCKQFGPRSDLTDCFETLIVFLKDFSKKDEFEKTKKSADDKIKHKKLPGGQRVIYTTVS